MSGCLGESSLWLCLWLAAGIRSCMSERGELSPYGVLRWSDCSLQSLSVCHSAACEPHQHVMGDNALYRASAEGQQQFLGQINLSQWLREKQLLLCLFHKRGDVKWPCRVWRDVCPQKFKVKRSRFLPPPPPTVCHQFFGFGGVSARLLPTWNYF